MWELLGFAVGIVGGIAGAFVFGLVVTLLLPVLLVALSRRHGKGSSTLLGYAAGLVIVSIWFLSVQTGSGKTPAEGAIIIIGIMVAIAIATAFASRTRFVRGIARRR